MRHYFMRLQNRAGTVGRSPKRRGITAVQTALVLVAVATGVIAGVRGIGNLANNDMEDTAVRVGDPALLVGKFSHSRGLRNNSGGNSGSNSGSNSGNNSGNSSGNNSGGNNSGNSGNNAGGNGGSNAGGSGNSGGGEQGGLCP